MTGVSLDIKANGVDTLLTFGDAASTVARFTDHVVDVGALSGGRFANGSLNLVITLSVTTNSAGSDFHGGIIVAG